MAITVESTSSANTTSLGNLTISAPSGIEVGDLLVAVLACYGGTPTITTKSGWTLAESQTCTNGIAGVQYKIADSSDAAAPVFIFTFGSSTLNSGTILRISGHAQVGPVEYSESDFDNSASGTTITHAISITPAQDGSLLIMNHQCNDGAASGTPTMSGYYVTGASPTWTELHDYSIDLGGNTDPINAAAYAILSTSAALTAFGAVTNINRDNQAGNFLVVQPQLDASGSNSLVTTDAEIFGQSGACGTVASNNLVSTDTEIFSQVGRGETPTIAANESKASISPANAGKNSVAYTNNDKSSSTWTPQEK